MSHTPKKRRRHETWWSRTIAGPVTVRSLLVVLGLAIVMQYLDYRGALSQWDGSFLDIALLWGPPSPNPTPVITVEIDNLAYEKFFGSISPLDPKVLLKIVEKVASIRPKPAVIGIDILTESPEYAGALKEDWFQTASTVWAAEARPPSPASSPGLLGWFFGMEDEWDFRLPIVLGTTQVKDCQRGASIYFPDRDLRMRKLTRKLELAKDSAPLKIWARQVADASRHDVSVCPDNKEDQKEDKEHEVLVSYNALAPLEYKVNDLFVCQPAGGKCNPDTLKPGGLWREFEKEFQRKPRPVVLIGGTYEHRDYPTPIGPQPALIVDAYAVQAELNHTYVEDFAPWKKFAFDIPLGLATGWLVHRFAKRSMRRGMQISFLIAAILIVVNVCLIHRGILWFSFAGVAFGAMLEQLVELYMENPKTAD